MKSKRNCAYSIIYFADLPLQSQRNRPWFVWVVFISSCLKEVVVNAEMQASLGSLIPTYSSSSSFSSSSPNPFLFWFNPSTHPVCAPFFPLRSCQGWVSGCFCIPCQSDPDWATVSWIISSKWGKHFQSLDSLQPRKGGFHFASNQNWRKSIEVGDAEREAAHLFSRACRPWWLVSWGVAASPRSAGGRSGSFVSRWFGRTAPGRSSAATPGIPASLTPNSLLLNLSGHLAAQLKSFLLIHSQLCSLSDWTACQKACHCTPVLIQEPSGGLGHKAFHSEPAGSTMVNQLHCSAWAASSIL